MSTEFHMPKLGLTMEAGIILEWLVANGEEVAKGQPLLLIETDKVESEVESSAGGRLEQVGVVGESYSCGSVIGWFLDPGEEVPDVGPPASSAITKATEPSLAGAASNAPVLAADKRIIISPNARRLAKELGVDLARVSGSGSGGRIVATDIELVARSAETEQSPPGQENDAVAEALPAKEPIEGLLQAPSTVIPMEGMRGAIARRMHGSLREMAQLTLTVEAMMDAVVEDRELRKAGGLPPSYTDYVIAAAAIALTHHPIVNSQITEEGIALLPAVNVGMAVALDDGLIVPVVQNAAVLGLSELAAETTRLANLANDSKLGLSDLSGGTFTVTTLGMFGVDAFTPVINPPNTAILGVGRLRDATAWSTDGEPVRRSALTLSLTWDHRAFDGAPAARFAGEVRDLLEAGVFSG